MYSRKRILGLIPARGGSKGLPRKNIKPLLGKPLISWTIEQALNSHHIDTIVVSTDDEEIADISKKLGAEIPFIRPDHLATDEAGRMGVIFHALEHFELKGITFDILAFLEPTSPLREPEDIDTCIERLVHSHVGKSIVSVSILETGHPEFNIIIDKETELLRKPNGSMDFSVIRRQDLNDIYFFDGTLYISEVGALKEKGEFYHDQTLGYVVPKWKSLEIDEITDFFCAEALLRARSEGYL